MFHLRGDTTAAFYAPGGEIPANFSQATSTGVESVAFNTSTCIGGRALSFNVPGFNNWLVYSGIQNTPEYGNDGITWLNRFYVENTQPTFNNSLWQLGARTNGLLSSFAFQNQASSNNLAVYCRNELGQPVFQDVASGSFDLVPGQMNDWVMRWDGTSTSNIEIFLNGSTICTAAPARGMLGQDTYPWNPITFGQYLNASSSEILLNESVILSGVLSAASIASAFPGPSRTDYYQATKLQGLNNTDPGVANVVGVDYIFQGNTLTGNYSTPDYTDPGVGNVAQGTEYIFNDNTQTGTLLVPVASTGPAGTLPLNELKEQIRYALFVNNTSTGAPTQNLSDGLSRPVRTVLKINPDRLGAPHDNALPAVTVFTDSKDVEQVTIATNQLTGKRRAQVNLKVMGMVWEPHTSNLKTDPADEECEKLMENIERIIRAYDTLGGNVQWHIPTGVTYHSFTNSEETHFRAGILDLQATLYY